MRFTAMLDVNIVAHEADDDVTVLLELEAPEAPDTGQGRPADTLQVVLDRSGSMARGRLSGAIEALVGVVGRLDQRDRFGVVGFDDQAQVVVPCGPLTDKVAVVDALRSIRPGGRTDLSAGYLRGLQELRRASAAPGAPGAGTVLVISDGHVNCGLTDVDSFADMASNAHGRGVVTSTLGYGLGYDETLLTAIARGGAGNHEFAEDPDSAGAAIVAEVDGLLNTVVQAASLTIRSSSEVQLVELYNDLPAYQVGDDELLVELGALYAQETRKLLIRFHIPAVETLGLTQVATLELRYVEMPKMVEHTVTLPITVNVVPGDEAVGRVPDPVVQSEILYQQAQRSKRAASEAFEKDDPFTGKRLLRAASSDLDDALAIAPAEHRADIAEDAKEVDTMYRNVDRLGTNQTSKRSRASYYRETSKRGRRRPSPDGN